MKTKPKNIFFDWPHSKHVKQKTFGEGSSCVRYVSDNGFVLEPDKKTWYENQGVGGTMRRLKNVL